MSQGFPRASKHGAITPVVEDLFIVRGTFRMGPALVISRTMTVIRTGAGLVLVNSVRLDEAGLEALHALGRVAHVVSLSDAHGLDDPFYVETYGATYWQVPGARRRAPAPPRALEGEGPVPGGVVIGVPNAGGPEAVLWVPQGGGTLVTCDVIQNHVDTEGASVFARVMTPLLGFKGGVIVPRMWRKMHKTDGAALVASLAGVMGRSFANLVTAHGPAVVGGADVRVRAVLAALAGG